MRVKRLLILFICLLCLLFASCEAATEDFSAASSADETIPDNKAASHFIQPGYASNQLHVIWDMKIWDGCLYIGAGDFDKNHSPGVARRYRFETNEWESCGTIPDEQIGRFIVLENQLMIPGFDPTEDWSLGNYYVLEEDRFITHRVFPNGIHCFDLRLYDHQFFAALGVSAGNMPVVSTGNNENFQPVPLIGPDGTPLSTKGYTEVRAYDLLTIGDTLYAIVRLDENLQAYKYDNGSFVYHSDLRYKLVGSAISYLPVIEKAVLSGTAFLTTGRLYCTENMDAFADITPDGIDVVADLLVYNDTLYLLGNTKTDHGYMLSVLQYNSDCTFETVKTVSSDLLSQSFAYDGEYRYIAIGGMSDLNHKDSGKILCLS